MIINNKKYCINKRTFHIAILLRDWHNPIIPVVTYNNIEEQKTLILENNKGKAGIYRWTNIINFKSYIGSANNLRTRFWVYFSNNRLLNSKMPIYKAILKYGYTNFKLEILEYCSPDIVLLREQHYIDILKPEYNVLSVAGSTIGYKHTTETMEKFKTRTFSDKTLANLSKAAKGRILSEEARIKISKARTGIKLSNQTKAKISLIVTERRGIKVEVTNIISGEVKEYDTLTSAGLDLNVSRTAIKKAMNLGKILKKTYLIKIKN